MSATSRAETAADQAITAAGLAVEANKQAEQHARTAEQLAPPDPHELTTASCAIPAAPGRATWSISLVVVTTPLRRSSRRAPRVVTAMASRTAAGKEARSLGRPRQPPPRLVVARKTVGKLFDP